MAKVRITSLQQMKTTILAFQSNSSTQVNELIYHPNDIDGVDTQLWAFKQNILVDVSTSSGPFMKITFNTILI